MVLILTLPIAILLATAGVAALSGVLVTQSCAVLHVYGHALIHAISAPHSCSSVHLLVDLPSLTLAVTSALTVGGYVLFVRRARTVADDLVASGLLEPSRLCFAQGRAPDPIKITTRSRLFWLAMSVAVTTLIYVMILRSSRLFSDFAGRLPAEALRASWWANWDHHKVAAVMWVAVGSAGAYYGSLFTKAKHDVRRWGARAQPRELFRYVPKWEDRSYGWGPAWRLVAVSYLGVVVFLFSSAALLYLLRGTGIALVVFAVGAVARGVYSHGRFLFTAIRTIKQRHASVIARQRQAVRDGLASHDFAARAFWASQAHEIEAIPALPAAGKWRWILPFISGLTAVIALVRAVIGVLAG